MSEGAWTPKPWEEAHDRPARLPRVGDLPSVDGGYGKEAVEAAFAAFHDHAARLDHTLQVLEAVGAFEQQATALRSDIRALRAAAWGPLPAPRSSWGAAQASRSAARSASVPAALPRLAVEAAFIILVAVGAGLAEVETPILVGLVLGAWAIVGLVEVLVASLRAQRRVVAPAPVAAGPLFIPSPPPRRVALEDTQEEAVIFEPAPELEAALEYEPELAADEEEYDDEDDAEEGDVADPWADSEDADAVEAGARQAEADDEKTDEQPAVVALVPEPEPQAEPERGRGRFWRRRSEPDRAEAEPGEARDDAEPYFPEGQSALRRGRR